MLSTQAWLGDLGRQINIYCERGQNPAWNAEPLNAVSNIAFILAAAAAWRLQKRYPNRELIGSVKWLCIIITVVGVGSAIFHTVATRWAEWADVIPILVFMLVYCWLILTAFFRLSFLPKLIVTALLLGATIYLESDEFEKVLWGGAMYLPTLLLLLGVGIGILRQDADAGKAFFVAAGLFVLSFAARTLDMPLCSEAPLGTHYLWHIFNAAVLYLLVRTLIVHAPGARRLAASKKMREPLAFLEGGKPDRTR